MKGRCGVSMCVVAFFLFFGVSGTCFSEGVKVGIGVSATQSGGSIYLPVKIPVKKKFILIEPMVTHYSSKETDTYSDYSAKQDTSETDVGLGVYLVSAMYQNMDLQIGVRGTYVKYQSKIPLYPADVYPEVVNIDKHGYSIAPVLGWNYNFNDHITLGATIAYTYTKLTGHDKELLGLDYFGKSVNYNLKEERYSTDTDIFLKYYF